MGYVEIDFQHLVDIYYEFVNGIKKADEKINEELSKMVAEEIYKNAKKAYIEIINNWYASYSPLYYKRQESLKKAAKITLQGSTVVIDINSDPLTGHHLGSDGLYTLTMKEGYHGGKMYRGPLYVWSHPTREAEKTFSPVEAMKSWAEEYSKKTIDKKKVESIIRKYYSEYEFFRLFY